MQPESNVNAIQASIMRQLFLRESLHFAEINVDKVPSDQFSYHLRQLIKYGLIEKSDAGKYTLSVMGRSRALLLSPNSDNYIEQGFVAVRIVLAKNEGGQPYFLMQERKLVPFKGSFATPGDKVLFGEDVSETAVRSLKRQTGLTCTLELCGMKHYKEKYLDRIVQDKFFFVFRASRPVGRLKLNSPNGKNVWMTREQLQASPQTLHGVMDIVDMSLSEQMTLDERTFEVESY